MAVVATLSNHFKFQLASGEIDFDTNTYIIILMDTAFSFDKDTHATLADVTANQISTANGYDQDTKTLAGVALTESDDNDQAEITWDDPTWTASTGDLGGEAIGTACIIDTTTGDDTLVGCIDFGADYTIPDGSSLKIENIELDLT